MESNVLVSVLIVTYNQQDFIKETIESVLIQKVNFKLEILIGEDCSSDSTKEIINECCKEYPSIIRLFHRKKNMGLVQNFADLLNQANGKYIASMGGDDYWTDEYKLQKQFDFLENNKEYSMIGFGALTLLNSTGQLICNEGEGNAKEISVADLFGMNPFHASEIMYRNIFLTMPVPDIFYDADTEDRQLYMLLGEKGKLFYNPQIVGGIYRRHENSITQSRKKVTSTPRAKRYEERIRKNVLWNDYFNQEYTSLITEINSKLRTKIFLDYLNNRDFKKAFSVSKLALKHENLSTKSKIIFFLMRMFGSK